MITYMQALTIAQQIVSHLRTGQPALDSFSFEEVQQAWRLLGDLLPQLRGTPRGKLLKGIVYLVSGVHFKLQGFRQRKNTPSAKRLQVAAEGLARLLELARQDEEDYWQWVTREAISQADSIIEQAVS